MHHTEVERKFAILEPGQMRTCLARLGAVVAGTSRQVDVYYNHPARDFLQRDVVSEWLRLRLENPEDGLAKSSINFKRWLPIGSAEATHADEFESQVADREAVARLLKELDFQELVTVNKQRERWRLQSPSGPVEIALDEVEGLGTFVEFEYEGDGELDVAEQAVEEAVGRVVSQGVALGQRDRRGYPYLLLGRE
ncbi:MAG: class IV adenylate cyclase [Planctomycetes bacterium]|nr:class IV adenylate cyclase [Planctomycetota bacterium]